jgi:hypothetical protein
MHVRFAVAMWVAAVLSPPGPFVKASQMLLSLLCQLMVRTMCLMVPIEISRKHLLGLIVTPHLHIKVPEALATLKRRRVVTAQPCFAAIECLTKKLFSLGRLAVRQANSQIVLRL